MVLDGRSTRHRSHRQERPPDGRFPAGVFDDYAADCARCRRLPGHRPGAVGRPIPPVGRPAGDEPARPPIHAGWGTPTPSPGPSNALYTRRRSGPDQRTARAGTVPMPATCCCWPTSTKAAGPTARYSNQRDAFTAIRCVDAPRRPTPRRGRTDQRTGSRRRSCPTGSSPGTPARHLRVLAGSADVDHIPRRRCRGPGQVVVGPPPTRVIDPIPGRGEPGWRARRPLITSRGTQHTAPRSASTPGGGELLRRRAFRRSGAPR